MSRAHLLWVPNLGDVIAYSVLERRLHEQLCVFTGEDPDEKLTISYADILADTARNKIFLSGERQNPSGFLRCHTFTDLLYVDRIYVEPEHREKKLGATFMAWAQDLAVAYDCRQVCLTVHAGNVDAIQFYDRLGYKPQVVGPTAIKMHKRVE